MQIVITCLIVLAALIYTANRWMPFSTKQRLLQLFGKTPQAKTQAASGSCGSCSSCGNCGSDSIKLVKK